MAEFLDWSPLAANNNANPPEGWPEGMQYRQVNDTGRENMATLARWLGDNNGTLDLAGGPTAYTLTTNGSYPTLSRGVAFAFRVNVDSTGPVTLTVNGVGPVEVVRGALGVPLKAGDLAAGQFCRVVHDGTRFVLTTLEGTPYSLAEIQGVDPNLAPVSGDVLIYDGNQFGAQPLNVTLSGLTDVDDALAPVAGDILIHDGTQFVASPIANEVASAVGATGDAPIYAARAWVAFNGVNGATILASQNIASVVRIAAGNYEVTFTAPMPSATYAAIASAGRTNGGTAAVVEVREMTASSVRLVPLNTAQNGTDLGGGVVSLAVFA